MQPVFNRSNSNSNYIPSQPAVKKSFVLTEAIQQIVKEQLATHTPTQQVLKNTDCSQSRQENPFDLDFTPSSSTGSKQTMITNSAFLFDYPYRCSS